MKKKIIIFFSIILRTQGAGKETYHSLKARSGGKKAQHRNPATAGPVQDLTAVVAAAAAVAVKRRRRWRGGHAHAGCAQHPVTLQPCNPTSVVSRLRSWMVLVVVSSTLVVITDTGCRYAAGHSVFYGNCRITRGHRFGLYLLQT